jgi:3-hydroxyacyl-[acyl-carrier-protein] dehydratase
VETVLTGKQLLGILPHRFPFLLIDKVIRVQEGPNQDNRVGRKVVCIKNVTFNEPFFQGHFPDFPIMPGVLQLEAMAQAAAIAYYRSTDPQLDFMITSVQDAKFRKPVVPGDTLYLEAEILKDRNGQMIQAETFAKVDGQVVAEATILAFMSPKSNRKPT